MERNDEVMLAVFKTFLNNQMTFPTKESLARESHQSIPIRPQFFDCYIIRTFLPSGFNVSNDVIRWHILMFIDEFLLPTIDINTVGVGKFAVKATDPTAYLNWSGQELFEKLTNSSESNP